MLKNHFKDLKVSISNNIDMDLWCSGFFQIEYTYWDKGDHPNLECYRCNDDYLYIGKCHTSFSLKEAKKIRDVLSRFIRIQEKRDKIYEKRLVVMKINRELTKPEKSKCQNLLKNKVSSLIR